MNGTQVQIECDNPVQQKNFAKWLNEVGFDLFIKSEHNKKNIVTCVCTDEKMEWGHYFEIQ